jgi:hypothetical protein
MLAAAQIEADKTKKGVLPNQIESPRQRLITSLAALQAVIEPVVPSTDPQAQKKADHDVDTAWDVMHGWVYAWATAPNDNQEAASELFQLWFGNGLGFLKAAYVVEYQESDSRLRALTADQESLIETLGGTPLLQHLRDCHEAYGLALGITAPKAAPAKKGVQTELSALRAALRDYIGRVCTYADPDIDGTTELATALLVPVTTFKFPKVTRQTKSPNPAPTPPVPAPPSPSPAPTPADATGKKS